MRPTILYKGKEYPLESINWFERSGRISHVTFTDDNGDYHVAHNKNSYDPDGYNTHGNLHLDLEKRVKWGETVATH